jgi:gamma-glutamyl hercynylcysteine S-oxide synthase
LPRKTLKQEKKSMKEAKPIDAPYFPFADMTRPEIDLSDFVGDDPTQRALLDTWRKKIRSQLDLSAYDDPDRAWYRTAFFERFVFMYDRSFYDPEQDHYRIDEYLEEGEREFGGPEILLLWQSYPRLGIDRRNQFDLYREMPGGLPALKALTDRCHERGVRVFLNYNPWDTGTRREEKSDGEALADILVATGADGLFLDTMYNSPADFRTPLLGANPACVFDPEAIPETQDLQVIMGSWLQLGGLFPPVIPTIRWLEPRFTLRGIARAERSRKPILHRDLFLGGGHVIWENLFGYINAWNAEDKTLVRKIARILRTYHEAFASPDWQPLIGTLKKGVYANRWPAGNQTIYTLYNSTDQTADGPAITLPPAPDMRAWNLLSGEPIHLASGEAGALLSLTIPPRETVAVLVQPGTEAPPDVGSDRVSLEQYTDDTTRLAGHEPRPVAPTPREPANQVSEGMVKIPGGRFVMRVRHNGSLHMETACYGSRESHNDKGHPAQYFWMPPFLIDRTEVTNEQYRRFLVETQYVPANLASFLKLWTRKPGTEGRPPLWEMPDGKADHPVVYVDLNDARAYARWAGKRLPREEEWQYAAQGTDGRLWPWGNDPDGPDKRVYVWQRNDRRYEYGNRPDLAKCNSHSDDTTPVGRYPAGASPFGVLDMAGNVWEWTESERDDGHTRYAIVRGGSFAVIEGSIWYLASGAQPCDTHEKMLLMYPGLDRCETIGFRCVKDVEHSL